MKRTGDGPGAVIATGLTIPHSMLPRTDAVIQ